MFLSLFIVFTLGVLGGFLFEKIRLPKLIFYIILGILLGPSLFNVIDESLLNISSYLRQIALVIILTRSGLSLDFKTLKQIGRSAILMCFLPACFEIAGVTIFAPIFLGISYPEALLLGSVLAAVSPAVVVPRMIKLQKEGYSKEHHVPELIMAGSSCDDIFVIVLFYSFKNLVSSGSFNLLSLLEIPLSIILGILLGVAAGFLLYFLFKRISLPYVTKIILMLGLSFGMIAVENVSKPYISISSLLGVIVMGIILARGKKEEVVKIKDGYNNLWSAFEILLFTLVGAITDVKYAFSKDGAIILGIIVIALIFRSLGVLLCILGSKFTKKEKLFIVLSYLPKATVQASIGGIALSEGLACGNLVLTAAVVSILLTAPIGAILMDFTYKKLLIKNDEIIEMKENSNIL